MSDYGTRKHKWTKKGVKKLDMSFAVCSAQCLDAIRGQKALVLLFARS